MTTSDRQRFASQLSRLLVAGGLDLPLDGNYLVLSEAAAQANQAQTNDVFSEKWSKYNETPAKQKLYDMQQRWYLPLYGFATETELGDYLRRRKVIVDAGCGLGYKSAWFAELAPESLVIGVDFSDAARLAALQYQHLPNLFFLRGDIAALPFGAGSIDYVSCDQVIMHTQDPDAVFHELVRVAANRGGEIACYFYARKALPRELLDDYFRLQCKTMSRQSLWELSEQLTELGKRLSELNVTFESPAIPALGIKAGSYDLQRFLYWNFLKCFWSPDLGRETSIVTNFDWYSPSNARRYSEAEVRELVRREQLSIVHFHQEEACHSGRFAKSR